jgi:hypothetical protein
MDCSESTLQHIDLLTREVFLPMLCVDQNVAINAGVNSDKLMDILHRLMGVVETTEGHVKVCCIHKFFFLSYFTQLVHVRCNEAIHCSGGD